MDNEIKLEKLLKMLTERGNELRKLVEKTDEEIRALNIHDKNKLGYISNEIRLMMNLAEYKARLFEVDAWHGQVQDALFNMNLFKPESEMD